MPNGEQPAGNCFTGVVFTPNPLHRLSCGFGSHLEKTSDDTTPVIFLDCRQGHRVCHGFRRMPEQPTRFKPIDLPSDSAKSGRLGGEQWAGKRWLPPTIPEAGECVP